MAGEMNRRWNLPLTLSNYPDHRNVLVHLSQEQVQDWILDLSLLNQGLVDSIEITGTDGFQILDIAVDGRIPERQVGRVTWRDQRAELRLSPTEIDRWLHFYLTYWRDGFAAVDHIDAELESVTGSPGLFLTLSVPVAKPPSIGGDELRRRLGLPPERPH